MDPRVFCSGGKSILNWALCISMMRKLTAPSRNSNLGFSAILSTPGLYPRSRAATWLATWQQHNQQKPSNSAIHLGRHPNATWTWLAPGRLPIDENLRAQIKTGGRKRPLFFLLHMIHCASSPVTPLSRSPINEAPEKEVATRTVVRYVLQCALQNTVKFRK